MEPSYVIRKFLDAQRIHNLTAYLQTLHRQSLANADHTTLLLNCYTKLKDSSKLEEFIKVQGGVGGGFCEGPTEHEGLHQGCRDREELTLFGDQSPLVYKLGRGIAFFASFLLFSLLVFFFSFWLYCVACQILVLPPGIKPGPPAVEAQSPNHWTAREFPPLLFFDARTSRGI